MRGQVLDRLSHNSPSQQPREAGITMIVFQIRNRLKLNKLPKVIQLERIRTMIQITHPTPHVDPSNQDKPSRGLRKCILGPRALQSFKQNGSLSQLIIMQNKDVKFS